MGKFIWCFSFHFQVKVSVFITFGYQWRGEILRLRWGLVHEKNAAFYEYWFMIMLTIAFQITNACSHHIFFLIFPDALFRTATAKTLNSLPHGFWTQSTAHHSNPSTIARNSFETTLRNPSRLARALLPSSTSQRPGIVMILSTRISSALFMMWVFSAIGDKQANGPSDGKGSPLPTDICNTSILNSFPHKFYVNIFLKDNNILVFRIHNQISRWID